MYQLKVNKYKSILSPTVATIKKDNVTRDTTGFYLFMYLVCVFLFLKVSLIIQLKKLKHAVTDI